MILCASQSALRGLVAAGLISLFTMADAQAFDQAHGREQLNRVLVDCPQLRAVASPGNPNWNWLVAAFGDTQGGFAIRWTNRISPDCANVTASSSAYPDSDRVSLVRVDDLYRSGPQIGQPRTPDEIMSGLVFELNNVRLGPTKREIAESAASGRMDRSTYILACAREEFTADQETAVFYHQIWASYCVGRGLTTSPRLWYASIPSHFEKWITRFPATFWYPWRFFGERYDRLYSKVSIRNP